MKHVRRGVAGAASHMRHDWRPFQNIWAIYAAHRALTAAGLTCHYHRGRRRAATAQRRTQTRRLRNAPSTGLMRDGPVVPALYPNWIESQHVLAPARQSKSGETAYQERE